jgi:uncharacterized membrane protein YqjE
VKSPGPAQPGIRGALRALGDGVLGSIEDRMALFALEVEEEKRRLIRTMIWISATLFTAVMATGLATLTVVYLFWDSARIVVLASFAGFYAALLATSVIALRRATMRQDPPFAATIAEIQEDRRCIRGEK